jgi:hypothetical protein
MLRYFGCKNFSFNHFWDLIVDDTLGLGLGLVCKPQTSLSNDLGLGLVCKPQPSLSNDLGLGLVCKPQTGRANGLSRQWVVTTSKSIAD